MEDSRKTKLAKLVITHCLDVKPGQNIVVSGSTEAEEFIEELYKQMILAKANPLIKLSPKNTDYFFFKNANKEQLKKFPKHWLEAVKGSDSYITIDTTFNTRQLSSCDPKKIALRMKTLDKIETHIYNSGKMKNLIVTYPCLAHAIEADMSLDEWKDFVYSSCLIDWKKFAKKYERIAKHFHKGEEVHLIGENVDLKFSIKNKNALLEDGKENMPGGEIYMAPIRNSMNGWIKFEFPAIYNGNEILDISLKFKDGKVIEANASKNKKVLLQAISTDKNSGYIGEFGIGINPGIKRYTKNLMFDEKMEGTIHLALGMAYKENGGGNDSEVHWDIVKDMRKSKIVLDGKVVQENGKWKI